jgi:mevalonate kinase
LTKNGLAGRFTGIMSKICYSAPGKVIFSGEHSVVWGEPALLAAIDLRLKFTVESSSKQFKFEDPRLGKVVEIVKDYLVSQNIPFEDKTFAYHIDSNIPMSRGFGSSAALSVAAIAAFLEFFGGKVFDTSIVNQLAYQSEVNFHGKPSGADNSASSFGGFVWFRKEFEFLKVVEKLPFEISSEIQDRIFLIDSGDRKETTKFMVELVKFAMEENPAMYKKMIRDMGKTTKALTLALAENKAESIKHIIDHNQKLLQKLGVVSEKTRLFLQGLKQFGSGKIIGAGGILEGSGYILFWREGNKKTKEALLNYLDNKMIPYFPLSISNEGLKKEI